MTKRLTKMVDGCYKPMSRMALGVNQYLERVSKRCIVTFQKSAQKYLKDVSVSRNMLNNKLILWEAGAEAWKS